MFCHKCGSQIADGATFCHKCGAKMTSGDTTVQTPTTSAAANEPRAASISTKPKQPQTHDVPCGTPQKKKSKKLPIILGAVALVIVLIVVMANLNNILKRGEQARKDEDYIASRRQSSTVSLSETYTNDLAGISFHYPAGWVILDSESEFQIVNMIDSQNNADSIASFKVFRIFDQDPFGVFTGDETSVRETVNENATFLEFGSTMIGDVPAKSVTYQKAGLKGDDIVTNFWYVIGEDVYQITCSYSASRADTYKPSFDAIMKSYTITAASTSGENGSEIPSVDSQSEQWTMACADKVRELAAQDNALQFALIDLTGSSVPELVADYPGYRVSVFTWTGETLIAVMEDWPYGAMGNLGYEYLTGGNVIRNYNNDHAGAIVYESYMKVNDAYELVELNEEPLSIRYCKDINGNGQIDENEYVEAPLYYYGEKEITEKEYASYQIPGDYKQIAGDKSAEAILSQLGVEIGTENQEEGEILYKGQPITRLLGSTPEELNQIFGAPTDTGILYGATEYYTYNDVSFMLDGQGTVFNITVAADAAEINGAALDQNRTGIIHLLGTPGYEEELPEDESGEGLGGYYIMEYTSYEDLTVTTVQLPDADSKANSVTISRYDDGPGDEEYQEQSNNIDSSSPLTADGNTLSVGSLVYAKQNVFGVSVNYVRGYVTAIDNAGSVSVQWDTLLENRLWAYDECAILSDSTSPTGYSYYSGASGKQIPLAGVKFTLSANELYSKIP